MFDKVIGVATPERLSAALVYATGSILGAYAARGLTPLQWGGGAIAVIGSILVAVLVRTWPQKRVTAS